MLYVYPLPNGQLLYISEDAEVGYGDGDRGDQTTHFNAGLVNGSLEQHHYIP